MNKKALLSLILLLTPLFLPANNKQIAKALLTIMANRSLPELLRKNNAQELQNLSMHLSSKRYVKFNKLATELKVEQPNLSKKIYPNYPREYESFAK